MSIYEPGSVFKAITIAIGLDANEVIPQTKFLEDGPIKIDTGQSGRWKYQEIGNAGDKYRGWQTVTQALENSSNIGLAFVARKL